MESGDSPSRGPDVISSAYVAWQPVHSCARSPPPPEFRLRVGVCQSSSTTSALVDPQIALALIERTNGGDSSLEAVVNSGHQHKNPSFHLGNELARGLRGIPFQEVLAVSIIRAMSKMRQPRNQLRAQARDIVPW